MLRDSVLIEAWEFDIRKIPNVFTPNQDNKNQTFILPEELEGASIQIYNRWGGRVFQANAYKNDWNGRDLPVGLYYYLIGHPCLERTLKGWVQILR
ncbi:MAG: gliding motility-associated C-terminal domain-containing protein [Bacteroidia bacterium]|nr:gliding motility-associated C-terminal domain-containing protein [Bacteroidia bacterium]